MQNPEDVVAGLLLIAWFIAVHVGMAVVFRKVGRPMWFALVPGLNMYEICKAARVSGLWALAIFVPLANFGACFYVAIKLAERFGASDWFGIALGCTGFGTLPLLALHRYSASEQADETETDLARPTTGSSHPPRRQPTAENHRRTAMVGMIVLTMVYCLCLLCVPGLMIVGVMAFGGVSQVTPAMEVVIGLAALVPVSLLVALSGGWIFYHKKKYGWALGLSGLPALNMAAALTGFVVVLG